MLYQAVGMSFSVSRYFVVSAIAALPGCLRALSDYSHDVALHPPQRLLCGVPLAEYSRFTGTGTASAARRDDSRATAPCAAARGCVAAGYVPVNRGVRRSSQAEIPSSISCVGTMRAK